MSRTKIVLVTYENTLYKIKHPIKTNFAYLEEQQIFIFITF